MEIKYFKVCRVRCKQCGTILEYVNRSKQDNGLGSALMCDCGKVGLDPSACLYRILGDRENYEDLSEEWSADTVWLDRFIYRYHLDRRPDGEWNERLEVGFCPEGAVKVGQILRVGDWTQEVLKVEPHYKEVPRHVVQHQLDAVEQDRAEGKTGCTVEELDAYLDKVIETDARYCHGSHIRRGEPQDREEVRKKKLQDFLSDDRQKTAESLFGILPTDAKEKRYYTQEEVEKELGLNPEGLKNFDDVEFD